MRSTIIAFALLACGTGLTISSASAYDHLDDIAILTEKKVTVWPKLYAERDAAGLDKFLADDFKVLEADGSVRIRSSDRPVSGNPSSLMSLA